MSVQIHEFDPQIYPRKVWIAVGKNTFSDKFDGLSEWDEAADAMVDNAYCKQTKKGGIFVRFENKAAMRTDNITHEASHVAMEIFDYIGAKVDLANQECFSYLCGWIAKCIEEVKQHKNKK